MSSKSSLQGERGFTLAELVVAIGIIGILFSVVFANYRQYDSRILLQNLAHEIAISVREAQILSISVTGASNDFNVNYGVEFTEAVNNRYSIFSRVAGAGSGSDTDVRVIDITRGNRIGDIILCEAGEDYPDDCDNTIESAKVLFKRPHLIADIEVDGALATGANEVILLVSGPVGTDLPDREVHLSKSGRITVR